MKICEYSFFRGLIVWVFFYTCEQRKEPLVGNKVINSKNYLYNSQVLRFCVACSIAAGLFISDKRTKEIFVL